MTTVDFFWVAGVQEGDLDVSCVSAVDMIWEWYGTISGFPPNRRRRQSRQSRHSVFTPTSLSCCTPPRSLFTSLSATLPPLLSPTLPISFLSPIPYTSLSSSFPCMTMAHSLSHIVPADSSETRVSRTPRHFTATDCTSLEVSSRRWRTAAQTRLSKLASSDAPWLASNEDRTPVKSDTAMYLSSLSKSFDFSNRLGILERSKVREAGILL
mmetsp:Transcript_7302/g.14422  ORF Transcript_7302/g.14422 Transcript_7302/m.14422 type:complete len:211 (-) Transcript_7302:26-658(-)